MTTSELTIYDQLRQAQQTGGVEGVLDLLVDQLRQQQRYHELFEALKMQVRRRLGLPLLYSDTGDELSDAQRDQLEEGLIVACREVGLRLLEAGRIREGWMYLRPVGDRAAAAEAINKREPTDENLDEFVEVLLHEGVDSVHGYRLVLRHYGTCNAITTFDTVLAQRPKHERRAAAGLLLEHVHRELLLSLRTDIQRQEGKAPAEETIAALVAERDWLFGEFAYHLDTTHLASTVRTARLVEDPQHLRLALDLTAYGRRLNKQFQYRGEEPFVDIYPTHALYFQALLGENVEEAVTYFSQRAQACQPQQEGPIAIEVYIDLLARLGRYDEAIQAAIELMPADVPTAGLAPSLLELCQQAKNFDPLISYCQQHNNLLGFVSGLVNKE